MCDLKRIFSNGRFPSHLRSSLATDDERESKDRVPGLQQQPICRRTMPEDEQHTLTDWAVKEALRMFGAGHGKTAAAIAVTAARRAPGLAAAAEALRTLSYRGGPTSKAISASLASYIHRHAPISTDDKTIDRVKKWLIEHPYELVRCRCPLAALAAAAPIAMISTQMTSTPRNVELEQAVKAALALREKARAKARDNKVSSVIFTRKRTRDLPCTQRGPKALYTIVHCLPPPPRRRRRYA